ncbi:MAG: alanine/glycine:cation symporter family protein [Bacteroidales bacterium]|nr:alanine/glycine:cation symporter family protein [Bacteroidales bacterium]
MEELNHFFVTLSGYLWGWPTIILLLGTHVFLTIRLRFPQRHILKALRLSVTPDKGAKGDVSQFGSLATALAATIGTGNIVGVATAVALGGPGAVLWCWLTGVFGMSTKYGESLLAVKYRERTADGKMAGGPMYALEKGLGWKWLAVLFAIFTVIASFGIGNTVQANAIAALAEKTYSVSPYVTGAIVALFTGAVVVGGVKSIAKVCEWVVPLMALLYIVGCVYVLCLNAEYVIPAIVKIGSAAFSPQAMGGGFVGSTILIAARYGIARGLFSNESGLGSASIAAAAAQTKNPVRQALVASTGTFWDTVVICAITGIVLVSCILANPGIDYKDGAELANAAFGDIPVIGKPLLSFGMFTFAFTTILGWSYYGERAMEYLNGGIIKHIYRWVFVASIFFGSVISLNLVWNVSDCMNALMAIPNLVAVLMLSSVIVKETRHYLWEGRLDEEMK